MEGQPPCAGLLHAPCPAHTQHLAFILSSSAGCGPGLRLVVVACGVPGTGC